MQFDTTSSCALHWSGVSVVNLKTPVTYPVDGVSTSTCCATTCAWQVCICASPPARAALAAPARAACGAVCRRSDANAAEHQVAPQPHWASLREAGLSSACGSVRRVPCGAVGSIGHAVAGRLLFHAVAWSCARASLEYLERVGLLAPMRRWPNAGGTSCATSNGCRCIVDKALAWTGALDVGRRR